MSENADVAKRVGVRFPFINLEKAIGRAAELYKADPRGRDITVPGAFGTWKYSDKSSGGFQTIGALKMYGLLKDSSAGDSRKVALTESALRYFRDEREEERQKLVREFALKPKLINALWQDWHASPPSDMVARSHLKADRQLTDQASRSLLAVYKENLAFAKITGDDKSLELESAEDATDEDANGSASLPVHPPADQPKAKVGDYVQWTSMGMDQFVVPARVVWVSDDGTHLRVEGSSTGIPMNQVEVADPPKRDILPSHSASAENQIQVLLDGNRLRITASVDRKGLGRLKRIIAANEALLEEEDA